MSTVFILRENVSTFLSVAAGTDEVATLAAYSTIIGNASVDIKLTNSADTADDTGEFGPRISIFLEDLGHVHSKKVSSFSGGPSKTLVALQRLLNAYMKNPTPINPGAIGSDMNPTCLPTGQQDTEEYLVQCIFDKISPPLDIYTINETSSLRCSKDNKEYSKNTTTTGCLNIQVAKDLKSLNPINMIDKLIEYTATEQNFQMGEKVEPVGDCDDTFDGEGKLTSSSRQKKLTIQNDKNTYMIVSLKILYTLDRGKTYDKYLGKITIASSFYINADGEFSNVAPGTQYTLLGFTAHYGGWSGGHYVYYKKIKKDGTDNWVKISDNVISTPMSETDALSMKDGGTIQCKDFLYIKTDKQDAYFAKPIVTKGFVNSTTSLCYANSMNQLLVSMPEFVDYIQKLSSGPPSTPIRVVSYNILSSFLADKMVMTDKKYENNDDRLNAVTNKLQLEIDKKSIICLQEVSSAWKPLIEKFFTDNKYTVNNIENYTQNEKIVTDFQMGVAIAYPTDVYTVVTPYKSEVVGKSLPLPISPTSPQPDEWKWARGKQNKILHIMLKHNTLNKQFAVSTYHMPNEDGRPVIMCIHAALAAHAAQKFADKKGPYILCGDFNTKPTNEGYTLFTTGKTSLTIPDEGVPKWEATIEKLRSAYAVKGSEPMYTCGSLRKSPPPPAPPATIFKNTIDYIFLSDGWKVTEVLPVPTLGATESIPNETEPSDHVMIGATLSLD